MDLDYEKIKIDATNRLIDITTACNNKDEHELYALLCSSLAGELSDYELLPGELSDYELLSGALSDYELLPEVTIPLNRFEYKGEVFQLYILKYLDSVLILHVNSYNHPVSTTEANISSEYYDPVDIIPSKAAYAESYLESKDGTYHISRRVANLCNDYLGGV